MVQRTAHRAKIAVAFSAALVLFSQAGKAQNAIEAPCESSKQACDYARAGQEAVEAGNFSQALTDFNQAMAIDSTNTYFYFGAGQAYQGLNNNQSAVYSITEAIQLLKPSSDSRLQSLVYYNRGVAYVSLGQYQSAIDDYTRAIQFNPRSGSIYYDRASALIKNYRQSAASGSHNTTQLSEAESDLHKALEYHVYYKGQNLDADVRQDLAQLENMLPQPGRRGTNDTRPNNTSPLFVPRQ